ncbi:MAG: hypothetical protein ACKOA9_01990 [Actinomycetota bacterium]
MSTHPGAEPRRPRAWFRGRSYTLGAQLDTFLVCAATGVVVNRAILIALGYPQIGSRKPGGIHISHSIYGGFAMMVAATVGIAFLAPATRWFVAIVGGLGFGWYVDELGKYVSNAGYLFRPALALIYVVFTLMFLTFNAMAARAFTPDDAVANALESLKSAALGNLDDRQRREAILRLERIGSDSPFAARVHALLADAPASPPRPPGRLRRMRTAIRGRYRAWTHRRSFTLSITIFFVVLAVSTVGEIVGLTVQGPGFHKPAARIAVGAAAVAGLFVLIGVVRLRHHRLSAYRWFDRALLVRILVVQVFLFQQQQFAATLGLAVDLFVWAMVRSAIAIEEQRLELVAEDAPGVQAATPGTTS